MVNLESVANQLRATPIALALLLLQLQCHVFGCHFARGSFLPIPSGTFQPVLCRVAVICKPTRVTHLLYILMRMCKRLSMHAGLAFTPQRALLFVHVEVIGSGRLFSSTFRAALHAICNRGFGRIVQARFANRLEQRGHPIGAEKLCRLRAGYATLAAGFIASRCVLLLG